jgi:Zn-dependent protease with chaperone function
MDRADFIHLVRLSENASADNSQAYRRSVALYAALGYLWVLGCFFLSIGILYWAAGAMMRGQFRGQVVWLLVAAAGLLWTSLRALWIRLDAPVGLEITANDAPALFESLERIRKKIKGPPIHHVLLNAEFNASISQIPRFGLFGGAVNYLTIGLPLLMAVDRPRFLAVMAHEYGHLRGDHGQFAAWVYRTRLSWMKMEHGMRNDANPVSAATQAFLRWYFPRFLAKTFAMARQDEYEADSIAGKLLGPEVAGAALSEIAIKGAWIHREFWPLHWRGASASAQPTNPFAAMRALLALPPPDDFARDALKQSLRQISDVDDTHPVLRDRLEALEVGKKMPTWSTKPALDLLSNNSTKWLDHFDKQWCRDNATDWKLHNAYLSRVRTRADALSASQARNSADEMAELGSLKRRLDGRADVRAFYERALQITPQHPAGLRGLAQSLPDAQHALRMDALNQLFDTSVVNRWWACKVAVNSLETVVTEGHQNIDHDSKNDTKALKLWRERLKDADAAESRAWDEMVETPYFQSIARHDLNEFEKGEIESDLARCKPIARAWLVRKNLKEFAYRRCYLLFVELPNMDDEDRYPLCRSLEQTLDLPGPVLVLWAGPSPSLKEIQAQAFDPVYVRPR